MRLQSADTDLTTETKQIELLRNATVAQRLTLTFSLSDTVIELVRRAIERAHPELSPRGILVHFVAIHYGRELAEKVDLAVKPSIQ
jgi:hypothetical protein